MKTIQYIRNLSFYFLLLVFLFGCADSAKKFSANVDVIYLHKKIDGVSMFGESYYAYGNVPMSNATIILPTGNTIQLDPYSSGYVFVHSPKDNGDYSATAPSGGTYTLNLTDNDGNTLELTDLQSFSGLGFTEIDSMTYYDNYDGLYFKWNEVSGADSYVVCLYDSSDHLVFTSYAISPDSPKYVVVTGYYGTWNSIPVSGEKYTLQVQSIIYDDDATDDDYFYNIQEISYTDFEIIWQ